MSVRYIEPAQLVAIYDDDADAYCCVNHIDEELPRDPRVSRINGAGAFMVASEKIGAWLVKAGLVAGLVLLPAMMIRAIGG